MSEKIKDLSTKTLLSTSLSEAIILFKINSKRYVDYKKLKNLGHNPVFAKKKLMI